MTWVLVLYIYAGTFAKGDSVTLATVDGFADKARCEAAGADARPLVGGSAKELRFVCIQRR